MPMPVWQLQNSLPRPPTGHHHAFVSLGTKAEVVEAKARPHPGLVSRVCVPCCPPPPPPPPRPKFFLLSHWLLCRSPLPPCAGCRCSRAAQLSWREEAAATTSRAGLLLWAAKESARGRQTPAYRVMFTSERRTRSSLGNLLRNSQLKNKCCSPGPCKHRPRSISARTPTASAQPTAA
jgi:hypothetical protein